MSAYDDYRREREECIAAVHPACRAAIALGYQPFTAWCAERGVDPPAPDLTDSTVARKYKTYLAWRNGELDRLAPDVRTRLEPHMTPFVDWLLSSELGEQPKRKTK